MSATTRHPAVVGPLGRTERLGLPPIGWRGLVRLGSQGGWAVVDQALFAGSNLLVNVLLARWLSGAEYGAFVTAYSVLVDRVIPLSVFPVMLFMSASMRYAVDFAPWLMLSACIGYGHLQAEYQNNPRRLRWLRWLGFLAALYTLAVNVA